MQLIKYLKTIPVQSA